MLTSLVLTIKQTSCRRNCGVLGRGALAAVVVLALASRAPADPISTGEVLPQQTPETDVTKYKEVNEAKTKFEKNDFKGALESLKLASQNHPELAPGEVLMAQFFFTAARTARQDARVQLVYSGRTWLDQAVLEHADDPHPYVVLGELAFAEQRIADAGVLYEKASNLTAALADTHSRKGQLEKACLAGMAAVAETRRKWDEALAHLSAWIELDEKNAVARFRKGRALFFSKKRREAHEEFKAATALNGQLGSPDITMARLFDQVAADEPTAKEQALKWIKYAISQSPKKLSTQLGAAAWYYGRDDIQNAKKHAEEAQKIEPNNREVRMLLGVIARYEKKLAEAERLFYDVYLQAPSDFSAINQYALALADQNDESKKQRALELATTNFQQQPNSAVAAITLSWVYFRRNQVDQAAQLLQAVAARSNVSSDGAYYLGEVFAKQDRVEEAKRALRGALDVPGPFIYRAEAQKLLNSLEAKSPSPATSTTSRSSP